MLRHSIHTATAVANFFGGQFLDDEFRGAKHRHRWQTGEGAIFTRALESILATKTFHPAEPPMERVCRCLFQAMFEDAFPKRRPEFLKDEGGQRLELDGYSESLQLAFEYQGQQHFEHVAHFHSPGGFESQKRKDDLKRRLCEANGVNLIAVPYTSSTIDEMRKVILEACRELNVTPKHPDAEVRLQDVALLNELQRSAATTGQIQILSLRGREVQCYCEKHDFGWLAKLATVRQALKRGSGCEQCRMEKTREKDPRIKRRQDYDRLAHSKGIDFLDEQIPETTSCRAMWTCSNCKKPFSQSFQSIQAGRTQCKECTKKERIKVEEMHSWAQSHGGSCETTVLVSGETEVTFIDETGQRFVRTASFVVNDGTWPTNRKKVPRHDMHYVRELLASVNCELAEPNTVYRNNTSPIAVRCRTCSKVLEKNLRQLQHAQKKGWDLCDTCQVLARLR